MTAGLFVITDYYTSTRFRPVRTISGASETGHATNIIQGLAQGFQSTALPAILIAAAIFVANELAGITSDSTVINQCAQRVVGKSVDEAAALIPNTLAAVLSWLGLPSLPGLGGGGGGLLG